MKICSLSLKILFYGTYAILCHTVFIYMYITALVRDFPAEYLARMFSHLFEHTAMSALIIVIGAFAADYVTRKAQNDRE